TYVFDVNPGRNFGCCTVRILITPTAGYVSLMVRFVDRVSGIQSCFDRPGTVATRLAPICSAIHPPRRFFERAVGRVRAHLWHYRCERRENKHENQALSST